MIAHFSLTHLFDPAFALTGAGLVLLYALWRGVVRPRVQRNTASPSPEKAPSASHSPAP